MKPRVKKSRWRNVSGSDQGWRIEWTVQFVDTCGCHEEERFPSWARAVGFANRIASGVDRWNA